MHRLVKINIHTHNIKLFTRSRGNAHLLSVRIIQRAEFRPLCCLNYTDVDMDCWVDRDRDEGKFSLARFYSGGHSKVENLSLAVLKQNLYYASYTSNHACLFSKQC